MNPYFTEVIAAHVAIENWLGQGSGDIQALLNRFSADFVMIPPAGRCMDMASVSDFFLAQRGGRPGLAIVLEELTLVESWPGGAVVRYLERQTRPDAAATARWSTAVFRLIDGHPQWVSLHETWQGA
ncbi:hypothetical protein J3D56_002078 [Erwinia persicina]|uniref:DUF4440 domain-containing protein n=1 Tax=Erwinia TaxID=551 RepID=UPI0020A1C1CF|nr:MULTISPECIES: DUF4440 domain-containing protein [Erwinia]MCP1438642.1 hypothetical protein [Erwinia persicina]MDN4627719.1 DUF4440 domain-containing protein [Erwinia sp. PsM31]MDN8542269.1 DUF4440 domain-containing protein [Erwinia sp. BC051422]